MRFFTSEVSRNRRASWNVWVLLGIFCFVILKRCSEVPLDLIHLYELLQKKTENSGSGCQLPKLDPWDHSILQYVNVPKDPLKCKSLQPNLTFLDQDGFLVLNEEDKLNSGYINVECSFRSFFHNDGVDDDSTKFGDWKLLKSKEKIDSDFVEVECRETLLGRRIYTYHWCQTVKPKSNNFKENSVDKPSVLLFGIDSMSTGNVIRQLPLTYDFLTNQMKAQVFNGHVKVGDNTYINLLAVLTGKRSGNTKDFKNELKDKWYMFYDNWTDFMWDKYSKEGYATLFAEDRPDIHVFNYMGYLYGFKYMPTTHYFRPFWLNVHGNFLHRRSSAFCYDTISEHKLQLNWLESFVKTYKNTRSFSLYWNQNLSHDYLNKIGVADKDFRSFFERLLPYLDNTIVFVFSDHGHRYASIRESVIGRLEARMPFLAIYLPPSLREKYPHLTQNMQINSNRLTTMFDLHATLLDILGSKFGVEADRYDSRSYSLFRPVPSDRQCPEAHIPEEFCPCYQEMTLDSDGEIGTKAAKSLIDHLDFLLKPEGSKCAKLSLKKVCDLWIFLPHSGTLKDPQTGYRIPQKGFHINYRIVIEVFPNLALIEAVVKHDLDSGKMKIDGDIERNNKYANTSICVSDRQLRKICYCV